MAGSLPVGITIRLQSWNAYRSHEWGKKDPWVMHQNQEGFWNAVIVWRAMSGSNKSSSGQMIHYRSTLQASEPTIYVGKFTDFWSAFILADNWWLQDRDWIKGVSSLKPKIAWVSDCFKASTALSTSFDCIILKQKRQTVTVDHLPCN